VGGVDIHYDNPGEEINLFDPATPGRFYGYPYCWSEGIWNGSGAGGRGTQHRDPDRGGSFTEATCQDTNRVVRPLYTLDAHLAPLGVVQYNGSGYPADWSGDLFVVSHGSWNREIGQVGRKILRVRMQNGVPSDPTTVVAELGSGNQPLEGTWTIRPVGIAIDPRGLLTFGSDTSNAIYKIGYRP
jgi:glucose/arabinose dehydrogenase